MMSCTFRYLSLEFVLWKCEWTARTAQKCTTQLTNKSFMLIQHNQVWAGCQRRRTGLYNLDKIYCRKIAGKVDNKLSTSQSKHKDLSWITCRVRKERGIIAGAINACSSSLIFISSTVICQIQPASFRWVITRVLNHFYSPSVEQKFIPREERKFVKLLLQQVFDKILDKDDVKVECQPKVLSWPLLTADNQTWLGAGKASFCNQTILRKIRPTQYN